VTLGSLATEVGRVREAIGAEAGRGLLGRAPTPAARPDAVLATAGARLLAALVPPALGERLRAVERLFVVPHGAIHRLPLEVLPSPRGGAGRTWLDDGPPVAYVPSGSVLHWCRTRRAEQRRRPAQDVLVALGDPVYGAAPAGDSVLPDGSAPAGPGFPPVLPPLPGTRREVEDVAAAFAEAGRSPTLVRLLGPEATEARLAREAPRARFLHLATHGLVDETSRASHSALALTLPTAGGAGEDDGFLELIDLLEHWRDRLARCELVVLSACETQGGPLQKDEGVFALPWGFFYAGCPAVIASLWSVADESTAVLMADFYRRLLADPARDRLLAFTEARRTLKATHPDPRRWAPFVFVGDPK
jgi:CHAT domain-containing protein